MPHGPDIIIPDFSTFREHWLSALRTQFPTAVAGNIGFDAYQQLVSNWESVTAQYLTTSWVAFNSHFAILSHDQLENFITPTLQSIESHLLGLRQEALAQANSLEARIFDEFTGLYNFSHTFIIPEIRATGQNMERPLDELVSLFEFGVHPDLASIARTLGIEIPQIRQLLQFLLALGAGGDPGLTGATEKVASANPAAAFVGTGLKAISEARKHPSADSYFNWLITSGPAAAIEVPEGEIGALAARIGQAINNQFVPEAIDEYKELEREVGPDATIVDIALWAIGRGRDFIVPLVTKFLSIVSEVVQEIADPLDAIMFPMFDDMLSTMIRFVSASGVIAPHQGFDMAQNFLVEAGRLGTRAHMLAVVGEMIPYVKNFGLSQPIAFMGDMAAFGPVAAATWGNAIGIGVGRPAEYQINNIMRSKIPGEGDLREMLIKRQISEADFRKYMAFHGYLDSYVDQLAEKAFRDPRLTEIIRLATDVSVDQADVEKWLRRAGYSDSDISDIAPIIMQQAMRAERGRLISEIMVNLREGFITEEDADFHFNKLRLPAEARELLFADARLAFRRELIEEHIKTLDFQLQNGLIREDSYRLGLSALGVRPEKIAAKAVYVSNRIAGKIAQEERADVEKSMRDFQRAAIARLKGAFENGFINAALFELQLVSIGIIPEVAAEIVSLEEIRLAGRIGENRSAEAEKLRDDVVRFRQAAFVELFRKRQITNLQLSGFLLQLGLAPTLVAAIVERELALQVPTPKLNIPPPSQVKARELNTRARASLQIRFRKGFIDSDALLRGLVDLGVDIDIARADVELEVLKRQPERLPPQAPKVKPEVLASHRRQITDAQRAYVDGRVSLDTLQDLLSALVSDPETLEALLEEAFLEKALKELPAQGRA